RRDARVRAGPALRRLRRDEGRADRAHPRAGGVVGAERDSGERHRAGVLPLAPRRRRDRDERSIDQGAQSDPARRRCGRTEGGRGVSRGRRVELHHRPDDRRRRRADHRMSAPSPYAARPWLEHYDYWVRPHMTYPGRPLGDILALTALHRPTRVATHFLGAELTFLDLKQRSDALAASLADLGIGKGDRVAIMLPNCPQYIVATFAILRLGAVIVNINPSYTEREFLVIASDSTPRVLITLDTLAPMAQKAGPQTTIEQIIVTSIAEYSAAAAPPPNVEGTRPFADLTVPGTHHARAWRAPGTIAADDLAVLQYTGGTTGT